jgi:F-type H+-transporting ATPase subunit delta
MKISKQARREAKALFRASLKNEVLDETAARAAVQGLMTTKPRGYVQILEHFQRLIKMDMDRRSARIESAAPLTPALQEQVKERLAASYGPGLSVSFVQNTALIGGMRIRVGSDVYDGSIQAKLAALQESF